TPQNLTRRQKELLKEFEKASTDSTNPSLSGFAQRVKDFWERMAKH
ncbi:MAG: molecular chaperone DnaJ, partial [Alphaproteobacteria bacterium]